MIEPNEYLRRPFRWAHLVWALVAGSLCVLLIATGGGHPPPIILVPVVAAVWAAGHGLLWVARRLAVKGKDQAGASGPEARRLPVGLIVVMIATGAATSLGLLQLVVTVVTGRSWPFQGVLWPAMMVVWIVHAACLAGVLLRQGWSRLLAVFLPVGWSAGLAWQVAESTLHGRPDVVQIGLALGLVTTLMLLALHILRSQAIRAHFGSN